jgi:hypothetical protein
MTNAFQKRLERHFAEEAGKLLEKPWTIGPDREHPDFLIREDKHQFGLEVGEIFIGKANNKGSIRKKDEAKTQKMINAARREYESIQNIPLSVKFVGDLCHENMANVVPKLVELKLELESVGHQAVISIHTGFRAGLRIYVTKGFRPDWFNVLDRVGFVGFDPTEQIAAMVEKKSKKLLSYRHEAGEDIRLMIVANRIYNSGKLTLKERVSFDKKGFQAIYFFSYPEVITILD